MQEVMGEQFPDDEEEFQNALQNGEVICRLANKIRPNSIRKVVVWILSDWFRLIVGRFSWSVKTLVPLSPLRAVLVVLKWTCSV